MTNKTKPPQTESFANPITSKTLDQSSRGTRKSEDSGSSGSHTWEAFRKGQETDNDRRLFSDTRVRLNKLLSDRGVASRRTADSMIQKGLISVNGKRVFELGVRVHPTKDQIVVEGHPIKVSNYEKIYLMLHKPKGVMTTLSDPEGRPTVKDLLPKLPTRVYPVGRLDWDTEGLLLMTNDGDFANRVMSPQFGVMKTYLVKISGDLNPGEKEKLLRGVSIIGGKVKALWISRTVVEGERRSSRNSWWKVVIDEGKNRQIRQMFLKLGHDVLKLRRTEIGKLRLGKLPRGQCVFMGPAAVEAVFQNPLDSEKLKKLSSSIEKSSEKAREKSKSPKHLRTNLDSESHRPLTYSRPRSRSARRVSSTIR